jgi:hypothetical protein
MGESSNWRANLPSMDRVSFGIGICTRDASPCGFLEVLFMRLLFFWSMRLRAGPIAP